MKSKYQKIAFFLISFFFIFSLQGFAQGIKERMKTRLPVIEQLKREGFIGENNLGYLQFLGQNKKSEDVVQAENTDRKKAYSFIAAKEGTTDVLVGKRRAIQIADKADPGEWLQDANGNWKQKK